MSGAKWMEPRRLGCDVGESLSFCLNARGADRGDTFAAYTRLYLESVRYRGFSTHDTTSLFCHHSEKNHVGVISGATEAVLATYATTHRKE